MNNSISLNDVARSDRLPSLPQVAVRVIDMAQEPEPDFDELASVIRMDPALSGKILKTANSALMGLRHTVSSIEAALPQLGITMVRTLVLGFTLARHDTRQREMDWAIRKFWRCSLTQAVIAEQLAHEIPGADAPTFFLGGLLQDIGILALMHELSEEYVIDVLEQTEFPNVVAVERRSFGFTHVDVTREICERWRIDSRIIEAMAFHHALVTPDDSDGLRGLALALQAANLGAECIESTSQGEFRGTEQFAQFLDEHFQFDTEGTEQLLVETARRVRETAALFSFDVGAGLSCERIVEKAQHALEEIALQAHVEAQQSKREADEAHRKQMANSRRMREATMQDPLTGVYNRRFLELLLKEQLASEISKRKPIGLLFLDIDKFKLVNDDHGHALGDEAIRLVAKILNRTVRKTDYVIRYGGDEFLVVLTRVSHGELSCIADRIAEEVRSSKLPSDEAVHVTSSIGAVHYQPGKRDARDASWLIHEVDQAMYEAKRNGGDQVRLFGMSQAECAV